MSSSEASGSGMKKPGFLTSVLRGIDGTSEDKNNDYLCPVCVEIITEAHITRCGHTFCYKCIIKSIEVNSRCPSCCSSLNLQDTFPNIVMNDLISKYKTRVRGLTELKNGKQESMGDMGNVGSCDGLRDFLAAESANLTLPDVNVMLEVLTQKKHLLEAESCVAQNKLLYEFLKHLLQQKEEQRAQLQREVAMIKGDLGEVEVILKDVQRKCPKAEDIRKSSDTDSAQVSAIRKEMIALIDMIDSNMPKSDEGSIDENSSHLALRRKRMHAHFEDFVHCYFDCRAKELLFGSQHRDTPTEVGHGNTSGLEVFRENLVKFSSVGPKLKKAETKIFWDLSSDFTGIAVVGLGKIDAGVNELEEIHEGKENVRAAAAAGCRALDSHDIKDIVLENFGDAEAAAEGAYLSTFISQEFKAKDSRKEVPRISLHGSEGTAGWEIGRIKAEAQNWARKLTDTPANHMTPAIFCKQVASALENHNCVVQVHDQEWAEKKGMGSFLSVARGSEIPPKFLEISYKGSDPKDPPMVFVGKGVTFDTGGISIKGGLNMELMRGDMGGAACIVAMVKAVAELKIPRNIVALIPLTENMPSGKATKPGDVVYAMNGKSITIDNTDAEGRLILADALCYSQEFNPRFVVDVATLTGAMKISLSSAATGVWTNDKEIFGKMQLAGTLAGDRIWRFPLWQIFTDRVKKSGRSADMNNMPKGGKGGGSCFAASFLQEFVGENTPWMHMDIAGVMDLLGSEDSPYLPSSGMSGRPTRTLIQFVQQLS